jgi:S1-C subfamily serine protease
MTKSLHLVSTLLLLASCVLASAQDPPERGSFADVNRYAQQRSVKIYGAGGMKQLEAYQSGFLVSAEGHIATVASLVLDQDRVTVLLSTGQRLEANVVGIDPMMDIAVLKLDTDETDYPHFDLHGSPMVFEGMKVLAFSNLYNVATGDEPVSVLHGVVSVVAPLEARRGAFSTRYRGDVYIVDAATNNPGAPGGVLVDLGGQPLGMLGKELKSELTGTWLNYVLPLDKVAESVDRILSGELGSAVVAGSELPESPATFAALGIRLVPSVVQRTPPYIDAVAPGSPAASAGLMPDDLVISLGGIRTGTYRDVETALAQTPIDQPVRVTVLRGNLMVDVELVPMP